MEVRNIYIRPAIVKAGWVPIIQLREEEIFKGQVIFKNNVSFRNKDKILKPAISLSPIEKKVMNVQSRMV